MDINKDSLDVKILEDVIQASTKAVRCGSCKLLVSLEHINVFCCYKCVAKARHYSPYKKDELLDEKGRLCSEWIYETYGIVD